MAQVESSAVDSVPNQTHPPPPPPTTSSTAAAGDESPPTLDSLISVGACFAEAAAYGGNDQNESLEVKAEKALECPCIAHLRTGPCSVQFSNAFVCFLKSTSEEKGSDCVHPFVALQSCIKTNPNAFSKDVLEDSEDKEEMEKPSQGYRIIPPIWSVESRKAKPKL
ncbi:hypothetical protein Leryth_001371 [Lithospermum erythrorhizon]|nr:hypothetical protein Leryth_001371 [Lithospermum erythrorhizon]